MTSASRSPYLGPLGAWPPKREYQGATEQSFSLYDAFATERFAGNVAGAVILDDALDADLMQLIAGELGAPTTGFARVIGKDDVAIRFFTPVKEIAACGHVSIAIATELVARGVWDPVDHRELAVHAETKGGELPMRLTKATSGVWVELLYLPRLVRSLDSCRHRIETTFGVSPHPLLPISIVATGLTHLIVGYESTKQLGALRLDESSVRRLASSCGVDTICVFAPVGAGRLRMRDLTAAIGILEEPASGTTSSALAAYAARQAALGNRPHVAIEQGVEMGRPSLIRVKVEHRDRGQVAFVRGKAVKSVSGRIFLR